MLFRRPSDAAPLAADRVRTVLGGEAGGWVPATELVERGPAATEASGAAAGLLGSPSAAEPEEPGRQSESEAPTQPLARWQPSPDAAEQAPFEAPSAAAPDLDGSASQGVPVAAAPERVLRLPVALTAGRLDPGRRGATALVVAALLAALVTGLVVLRGRPQEVAVPDVVAGGVPLPGTSAAAPGPEGAAGPPAAGPPASAPTTEVVVAVAGKVVRPGLVRLPPGSRVDDAVRAAGGPLPGAGVGLLNLARVLVDGEQVLVGVDPPPGAPPAGAAGGSSPTGAGGLLDLNAATVEDFDGLPGIGPVLAQRIVDWRTEHGGFASVEQLREVTGIGESKYADLEAKVTV